MLSNDADLMEDRGWVQNSACLDGTKTGYTPAGSGAFDGSEQLARS